MVDSLNLISIIPLHALPISVSFHIQVRSCFALDFQPIQSQLLHLLLLLLKIIALIIYKSAFVIFLQTEVAIDDIHMQVHLVPVVYHDLGNLVGICRLLRLLPLFSVVYRVEIAGCSRLVLRR